MLAKLKPHQITVAVTGANGYIASEIVSQLLVRGYKVHATVRDPSDKERVGHLSNFVGSNNLKLFKADLHDSHSFDDAFRDCQVILHTASPVTKGDGEDPEKIFVEGPKKGAANVLDAIARSASKVQILVWTSSIAAISSNGGLLPEDHVYSEKDWSPIDKLQKDKKWYALGKTLAEKAVWDHDLITSKRVKLIVINPGFVFGPVTNARQAKGTPTKYVNALNGETKEIPNRGTVPVDVRDVARAHIRGFEDPEAEGRYACVSGTFTHKDVFDAFHRVGNFPKLAKTLEDKPYTQGVDIWDSSKCEKLIGGWRSLDESCRGMAESFAAVDLISLE